MKFRPEDPSRIAGQGAAAGPQPAADARAAGAMLNACDALLGRALGRGLRDAPALIHHDSVYTYGALAATVDRFGLALKEAGLTTGERVLFMLKDTPELVAGFLAAIKAGGVAIALNTRYAAADLRYAIADSGARMLFIDPDFLPVLEQAVAEGARRPSLLVVCGADANPTAPVIALETFLGDRGGTLDSAPTAPDDMAFWIYTSGTTGMPKAAMHRHRDVLLADRHMGEMFGIKAGDKLFSSSKLFFSFALTHCLLGGLRLGASLILDDRWPRGEAIAEIVARHRPDVMFSVPTIYRNLLAEGHAESEPFRAVRCFVSAGERLPANLFERWQAATGKPIFDGIGATETLFLFLANTPAACRAGATGRPQPDVELRLVDDRDRPISEPGKLGVLWVRMGSIAAGYWNQPEKSRASFDRGWYRTGDMFSFDADGWWYHHGRGDDLLKISGQWVSPLEIEDCALATPGVNDVAVVGVPNEDGLTRLTMFVVAAADRDKAALATQIQDRLKASLSIYKCPRNILFVDEVPRTATGKLQRFRLRALAEALRGEGAGASPAPAPRPLGRELSRAAAPGHAASAAGRSSSS